MDFSLILHTGFHLHPHGGEALTAAMAIVALGGVGYLVFRRGR